MFTPAGKKTEEAPSAQKQFFHRKTFDYSPCEQSFSTVASFKENALDTSQAPNLKKLGKAAEGQISFLL